MLQHPASLSPISLNHSFAQNVNKGCFIASEKHPVDPGVFLSITSSARMPQVRAVFGAQESLKKLQLQ